MLTILHTAAAIDTPLTAPGPVDIASFFLDHRNNERSGNVNSFQFDWNPRRKKNSLKNKFIGVINSQDDIQLIKYFE